MHLTSFSTCLQAEPQLRSPSRCGLTRQGPPGISAGVQVADAGPTHPTAAGRVGAVTAGKATAGAWVLDGRGVSAASVLLWECYWSSQGPGDVLTPEGLSREQPSVPAGTADASPPYVTCRAISGAF